MRAVNKEVNALRAEYPNADWRRKNEIFEKLSYIANTVGGNIYNNLKQKYGEIFNQDECLMIAYEKLHKILLSGETCTELQHAVYKACYKDLAKQHLKQVAEYEFFEKSKLDLPVVADEENWDDISQGKEIWENLCKYDTNEMRNRIMSLYFGFDGNNPHKQIEIIRMLKISREKVRRAICRYGLCEAQRVANCNKRKLMVLRLAESGQYSMHQIASKTELKLSQVYTIIKKHAEENE